MADGLLPGGASNIRRAAHGTDQEGANHRRGVAGPVTALALRRAGIESTIYEAYDGAASDTGAMLTVAPNGLAALDVGGLAEEVRSCAANGWR